MLSPLKRYVRDLPVQRKLRLMSFLVGGLSVGSALTVLFFWLVNIKIQEATDDLMALTSAVAESGVAPLALNDKDGADGVLRTYKSKRFVVAAAIYREDGSLLSDLILRGGSRPVLDSSGPALIQDGLGIRLRQPMNIGDSLAGYVVVDADLSESASQLRKVFAIAVIGSALAGMLSVLLLSPVIQRLLAGPLLALAAVVRRVGEEKDYSLRAFVLGKDEIGALADSFNEMLERIEQQNRSLIESENKHRLLFETNPLPVFIVDRESQRIRGANHAAEVHYGESLAESTDRTFGSLFHPETNSDEVEYVLFLAAVRSRLARHRRADGSELWVEMTTHQLELGGEHLVIVLIQDVTERRKADAALADANERLLHASRQAGMAEIASGVLHNVGNVLNSVNVSVGVMRERIDKSRVDGLSKAVDLLVRHSGGLGDYLDSDPKGRKIPEYLCSVAEALRRERGDLAAETSELASRVDHIKQIVGMQQCFARRGGVVEALDPSELFDEALRLQEHAFERHRVRVVRLDGGAPWIKADKHRVLQILVNLLSNAKAAMVNIDQDSRVLTLSAESAPPGKVRISVRDTGCGISPENLALIFQHGFTTKQDGHGFGLHSCANAASEMQGSLRVASEGVGHGAVFILELPWAEAAPAQSEGHTTFIRRQSPLPVAAPSLI
jgi:PAS domain S-box-containing protein